jgi:AcrR family transcriptional regulator
VQRIAVEDRRAALLAAALRVIGRDGIGRASTRAITAEAGMPTASFHYVFESYDAMIEQLIETVLEAQAAAIGEAALGATTLREFAGAALEGWLDRAATDPDSEIALHEIVTWCRSSADRHRLAVAVYDRYAEAAGSFVQAGERRFGARWTASSEDITRFVLVLTDGVAARWLVDGDLAAARRVLGLGADALIGLTLREAR